MNMLSLNRSHDNTENEALRGVPVAQNMYANGLPADMSVHEACSQISAGDAIKHERRPEPESKL